MTCAIYEPSSCTRGPKKAFLAQLPQPKHEKDLKSKVLKLQKTIGRGSFSSLRGIRNLGSSFFAMDWGVSENRGPKYSTLNGRVLIIRTRK